MGFTEGKLEINESIPVCAVREVEEEWNKSVNHCKRISRYLPYLSTSRRKYTENNLLVFDELHRRKSQEYKQKKV